MRVATVDIGSNTLLLLVAERGDEGELRRLRDECRFGRLSQGLDESGRLAPEAIERCLDFLRDYRALLEDLGGADALSAAGTESLRKAENAGDFLAPAREILGAPIEVVSGDREAELVELAVRRSLPELAGREHVIADVGGGSTEILVCDREGIRWRKSLPIGAVRLTERHADSDPATQEAAKALIADIDRHLGDLDLPAAVPLVGTSGTATTVAAVELKLRVYDPDRIHGLRLTPGSVDRQLARYLELTVAEKKALPGMEPPRADVIAAGCAIYARLLHRLQAPEMVITDRGVRWGLAYELAS